MVHWFDGILHKHRNDKCVDYQDTETVDTVR